MRAVQLHKLIITKEDGSKKSENAPLKNQYGMNHCVSYPLEFGQCERASERDPLSHQFHRWNIEQANKLLQQCFSNSGSCSSRRYGAPAPNRVGNGVRTRPHAPFEDRRVRSVSATRPGRSHALPRAWGRTHAPTRAREECSRALKRRADAPSRAGRGECTRGSRAKPRHAPWEEGHIKRDCPKYKAQDQSSDTAATAVMAVDEDESDVLLAASDDGKSDWVLDSGSAYHLCRDREVFSTYAACEGRIWMANNTSSRVVGRGSVRFHMADGRSVTLTEVRHVPNLRKNLISIGMLDSKGCNFDASGGILRVSKGNTEMLWGKKTRGLYRLEGNVQTGGATVRHGSSGISEKNGQGKQPLHRDTQSKRREKGDQVDFEKLYSEGRGDAEASLFCSRFDQWRCSLQLCAQGRRDGSTTTRKVTYFAAYPGGGCGAPQWGGAGHLGEKVQALRCGGAYTSVGSGVAR
ncbi:hypothetical protein Acr_11g0009630 [Actinidia rufa]|uniref:Retrovirus-related Pol polyprotein from transposon TNT 1-94-like beta-barrel domain-containing protein n=1 Tax=Actinidia rufa TaxID=165716 RepID=A0A7J0FFI2_9ERIC|nr:hypothetical protein Acr_11g0009630 [Actinidia rufa]